MDVHPTFLYESLWNVIGLLLLYFVVSRARRFDGDNTCFYFIWYGLGRFWIEGLRTDSLYLFHWTLFGQRIREMCIRDRARSCRAFRPCP